MKNSSLLCLWSLTLGACFFDVSKNPAGHSTLLHDLSADSLQWQDLLPSDLRELQNPVGMDADSSGLYIAQMKSGRVDVFDLNPLKYQQSRLLTSNDTGKTAETRNYDVAVRDSLVFVTGVNPAKVYIYRKDNLNFVGQLGDGAWWGTMSHTNSVAASSRYVFVRHQRPEITVFLRSQIKQGCKLGAYSQLYIDGITQNYDQYTEMRTLGDSLLYVFQQSNQTVYEYRIDSLEGVDTKNAIQYQRKFSYDVSFVPMGFAFGPKWVALSYKAGSKVGLALYARDSFDFAHLRNPQIQVDSWDGKDLPMISHLVWAGDRLVLSWEHSSLRSFKVRDLEIKEE